jgi:hypothetical protein
MPDYNSYATLDFHVTLNSPRERGRYRVAARGLSLYLDDVAQKFDLSDCSSAGCRLSAPAKLLTVGRIFDGDLHTGNTSYLTGLKIKVVRHLADNNVACVFQALTRRQEIMLDKLLLEMQKRSIATHATQRKRKYRWLHMLL